MAIIKLIDVIKYYEGLNHQQLALAYLQDNIDPLVLSKFAKLWRNASVSMEQKLADRLKQLNITLDKGINIICLEGCNIDYTLNSDEARTDSYNDLWLTIWYDGLGIEILGTYKCTTEPGLFWTHSSNRNSAGTARIEIDIKQPGIWMIGKHKNQYPAMVQIGNKIRIRRDLNKDGFRTGDKLYEGWFGINGHHGDGSGKIGRWSAGCVVIDSPIEFKQAMSTIIKKASTIGQTRFSLIVLDASKVI